VENLLWNKKPTKEAKASDFEVEVY